MELLLVRPSFLVSFRGQSWLGVLASALDKQRLMERWDVFYPLGRHAEQLFYKVHLSQSWLQAQLILTWRRWRRRRRKKKQSLVSDANRAFFRLRPVAAFCTQMWVLQRNVRNQEKDGTRERERECVCACVCQSERESVWDGWLAKRNMPRIHNEVDIWDSRQWGDVQRVTWPQTCGKKTKCNFHID